VVEDVVVVLGLVERECVLETRAASAAHSDAQCLLLLACSDEVTDLLRGDVGEAHC
jgi:hypothetical protein